jgi:hypothetical protein
VPGIDGSHGAEFCQAIAWGCFAPSTILFGGFGSCFIRLNLQVIDQYCSSRCIRAIANLGISNYSQLLQAQTATGEQTTRWSVHGSYATFISNYNAEAATEARHLKDKLTTMLSSPVFLDSDDLYDLRNLLDAVVQSDVLVLLQTTNLLTRPWCLLEIYTTLRNNVPIVTVVVKGAFHILI